MDSEVNFRMGQSCHHSLWNLSTKLFPVLREQGFAHEHINLITKQGAKASFDFGTLCSLEGFLTGGAERTTWYKVDQQPRIWANRTPIILPRPGPRDRIKSCCQPSSNSTAQQSPSPGPFLHLQPSTGKALWERRKRKVGEGHYCFPKAWSSRDTPSNTVKCGIWAHLENEWHYFKSKASWENPRYLLWSLSKNVKPHQYAGIVY